ncbi:hypothetical protein MTO96_034690 [Rhipicephalus appendiculatus]
MAEEHSSTRVLDDGVVVRAMSAKDLCIAVAVCAFIATVLAIVWMHMDSMTIPANGALPRNPHSLHGDHRGLRHAH